MLDTEHKELTVEAVRALRKDVYIRPNEARRKVYVVSDCRQLNQRDQDVLLKVVEEGPPSRFLFCADAPAALLESRPFPLCSAEIRRGRRAPQRRYRGAVPVRLPPGVCCR